MNEKMWYLPLIIILIFKTQTFDISSFHINFFKQESKLYYFNAMNNNNGDIYFEFWGETNKIRYFTGIDHLTEERLKFNENEIYSIETNAISTYHDSILVNVNNEINVFSINKDYFGFINIKDSKYTSKATKEMIFEDNGWPAKRNCIIKLNDNTYLLSILLLKDEFMIDKHYINIKIFKFSSNDINGYNELASYDKNINYMASSSCFQTENKYIQCCFSKVEIINTFTIGIYSSQLKNQKLIDFGKVEEESFTKIFHIKDEIGGYIFFNKQKNNAPTLLLKKLSVMKKSFDLVDVISNKENIIENIGYTIDIGPFSTDSLKIDDSRFIIIFTIKSTYKLLLCLFDFNKDFTGIRRRKYVLDLDTINIRIASIIKTFLFKDYFGLLFYDSVSEFPGYIFFNYINITSNYKIDTRTIRINDFADSSFNFSFLENLDFINNIYNGPIKIRIESFSLKEETGISTKSSKTNSEISIGDILDISDIIIFEKDNAQLHDYFLEFLPIVQEIDSITDIYGNYGENDQIGYFTKYVFNIIIPYGKNCSYEDFVYVKNEQEKLCLISCDSYKEKQLYQDETENICYNECSEAKNGNIYTYFHKCLLNCPKEYIPNKNNICVPNETVFTTNIYNEEDEIDNLEENSEMNRIIEVPDSGYKNGILDEKDKLNEILENIDSFKDDLRGNNSKFNFKYEESWVSYFYSDDTALETLEKKFPNLTIVNVNECKNKLIAENIIDNFTKIIIKGKQKINDFNNFEYNLYLDNGTLLNKSLCENTKIEISKPIAPNILVTANALFSQGYDMFDLSSNLYTDNCIPVELNNNDVTLSTRQKDIMSSAISLCPESCSYSGNNLNSNRVTYSCDYNFDERNKTTQIEKQEVKENFLSYIFNMINYKIITCYDIMNNWQNYISNYGFLIGAIIYFLIFILFIIYLFKGYKSIKIKYLLHEPKIDNNKKSYIIDLSDVSKKFKLSSSRNDIIINEQNSLFNDSKQIKKKKKIKLNPPKNKIRKSSSKKNLEINSIYIHKKNGNKRTKRIRSKIKEDEIHSKIIISINKDNINYKEEMNSIEYNELTYAQALNKDGRNMWQIFFSYFNEKLDLIQIFFYPKEFEHFSLSLTLYLYELLIDFTLNAILFSDDVISQKYYNNGNLLFITSNILSIISNIFSCFLAKLVEFLVNYSEILEAAKIETNSELLFYKIFIKVYKLISFKICIFYFFVFISGLGCVYYLLLFCAIYKKIQKNLFINYIIGILWSFGYKIVFSLLSTVMRKIALLRKYRRLYIISKFINEKL